MKKSKARKFRIRLERCQCSYDGCLWRDLVVNGIRQSGVCGEFQKTIFGKVPASLGDYEVTIRKAKRG